VAKVSATAPGFRYLGGTSRKYLNEATGQEISRRQYDQLAGRLKELGRGGIEKQNKANKALAEEGLRPLGPGRRSYKPNYVPASASRLLPLQGHRARRVSGGRDADTYDRVLKGLQANKQVEDIGVIAVFDRAGTEIFKWIEMIYPKDQVELDGESAVEMIEELISVAYAEEEFLNFSFHVRFKESAFRPAPPSKPIKRYKKIPKRRQQKRGPKPKVKT
jgi:hypothetical protein